MQILVNLYYKVGSENKSTSVDFGLMRAIALGQVCPTTLEPPIREALLAAHYLKDEGDRVTLTERLFWQTGVKHV